MRVCEQIGDPLWTREEMLSELDAFCDAHDRMPISNNEGGMRAPHLFATWFMLRKLQPDLVVESGVWKGLGTWLIEEACPDAKILGIDPEPKIREYTSPQAEYVEEDFSELDWSERVTGRSLVFFDDHQHSYNRLQLCKWFGFKHAIFEDNYPATQSEEYSLKKAFAGVGLQRPNGGARDLSRPSGIPQYIRDAVRPNSHDAAMLRKNLEIYYEFPPVFKQDFTRWGDLWLNRNYPTPEPLLKHPVTNPRYQVFWDEAIFYTWICYVKLK